MKNTVLKNIELINFKGIKNIKIDFNESTNIFGANGSGKTTIFDAFTWLLFGKDSTDRKDFEIKTLDIYNNVIPKIEHEVSAELLVDGEIVKIKRILREKWVKSKGELEAKFSGNETLYYFNDIPLSQREFQTKINLILDENIFKLITSPTAFNSLKWQDRRTVLIELSGGISDSELAKGNSDFESLLAKLSNKNIDELKKQLQSTIKKSKEDLKDVPTRIDEVSKSKPEVFDFKNLKTSLAEKEEQINRINSLIDDSNKAYDEKLKGIRENKFKLNNLNSEIQQIENNAKRDAEAKLKPDTSVIDAIESKIKTNNAEAYSLNSRLKEFVSTKKTIEDSIKRIETSINEEREKWIKINSEELVFSDDNDFCCPSCKRLFDAKDVEEKKKQLIEKFNEEKKASIKSVESKGELLKNDLAEKKKEIISIDEEISELNKLIENNKVALDKLNTELDSKRKELELLSNNEISVESIVENILSENANYSIKKKEALELKKVIDASDESSYSIDNSKLIEERTVFEQDIKSINEKLKNEAQIISCDNRIKELEEEEKNISQTIADSEKELYIIELFIKTKIDSLESKINDRFQMVKFKLFDTQINGCEVECCDALVDGVPFSDVNTASKINAGIDIINSLCKHYDVCAPIFIDNRESITNIIPTVSQVINLIVSEEDKKLRIN